MSEFVFKTFDPVVFPRLLFVAVGGEKEDIANKLKDYDDDPLFIEKADVEESYALTCSKCKNRKSGEFGTLVWLHDTDNINVKVVAHEAVHAASAIMEQCGIKSDNENDEAQAYLVGYCAECIWKVCHPEE